MTLDLADVRRLYRYDPGTGHFYRRISMRPMSKYPAGSIAGHCSGRGYIYIFVRGQRYLAHRVAWLLMHGALPEDIDHINGVKTDNRIANLRAATRSENRFNQSVRKDSTTGLKGVSFVEATGKWKARITAHGRTQRLGTIATAEEAVAAYNDAAARLHGEFAYDQSPAREAGA